MIVTCLKPLVACLLLLVVVLAGCGSNDSVEPTSTGRSELPGELNLLQPLRTGRDVQASDGRYTLRVPGDWVQFDDQIAELAFRTIGEDPALAINVVREELGEDVRVQVYAEDARQRIGDIYRNVISLSLTPVRIGPIDAYRWVYTASVGNIDRLFYQIYIVEAGQGFVLTGLAPVAADVRAVSAVFDAIAGSMIFARG